jgi:hypothetical protein
MPKRKTQALAEAAASDRDELITPGHDDWQFNILYE